MSTHAHVVVWQGEVCLVNLAERPVVLAIGEDGVNGYAAVHSMSITQAHALAQELLESARVATLNAAPPRTMQQHYDTITAPAKLTDYSGVFDWEEP